MNRMNELVFSYKVLQDKSIIAQFKPSPDSNYFKGHFPGYPIVPGVVLLEISLRILAEALNITRPTLNIKEMKKIRFMKPVFPGNLVEVQINFSGNEMYAEGMTSGESVFSFSACFEVLNVNIDQ